jgi:amino acid adenylation domain-containing protein
MALSDRPLQNNQKKATPVPAPAAGTAPLPVPVRVVGQARRSPDDLAVADPDRSLTYAQLLERARGWRAALAKRLPTGPEPIVGTFRRRDVDVPASQLGIWLARGAYLPLDPGLPAGRIAEILSDASCQVVVTTAELAHMLPTGISIVTAPDAVPEGEDGEDGGLDDPARLAYVIYTSGSTGRPKGVAVEHGSLARLLDWYCPAFGVASGTRGAMFNGLGFDVTVSDTWAPLSVGGELHLPRETVIRDAEAIADTIAERNIEHCLLSTAVGEILLTAVDGPPSLRSLVLAGDRLRIWPAPNYPAAVHNGYGPTEATVLTTATGDLRALAPSSAGMLPTIGRAVEGALLRLLDPAGKPVDRPGERGELWIGGTCLARGYYRATGLTAERFIDGEDGRWYRSGDICSWTEDGELAFHGRADGQVKLRGYRVELGEIEHRVLRLPGVRQCAVLPCEWGDDQVLIAWIEGDADPRDVRHQLSRSLPDYMVPTEMVPVAAMPLTVNGKIDRSALLSMRETAAAPAPGQEDQEWRNDTERVVAEIWAEVLGKPPRRDSDFFDLGGDSILAHRVTLRVRRALGIRPRIALLFDNRELAAYAAALGSALASSGSR